MERQELDFAITLLEGQGAKGLQHLPLLELPLVLLVPKNSRFRNASGIFEALATENLEDPLISITAGELAPGVSGSFWRAARWNGPPGSRSPIWNWWRSTSKAGSESA